MVLSFGALDELYGGQYCNVPPIATEGWDPGAGSWDFDLPVQAVCGRPLSYGRTLRGVDWDCGGAVCNSAPEKVTGGRPEWGTPWQTTNAA